MRQRIEPRIGNLDLDPDHVTAAPAKKVFSPRDLKNLAFTVLLLTAIGVIAVLTASFAGLIPQQFSIGTPKLAARLIILVGIAVSTCAMLTGIFLLFMSSVERGLLALVFPPYLLIGLKRAGIFWHVMAPWSAGILLVAA